MLYEVITIISHGEIAGILREGEADEHQIGFMMAGARQKEGEGA